MSTAHIVLGFKDEIASFLDHIKTDALSSRITNYVAFFGYTILNVYGEAAADGIHIALGKGPHTLVLVTIKELA